MKFFGNTPSWTWYNFQKQNVTQNYSKGAVYLGAVYWLLVYLLLLLFFFLAGIQKRRCSFTVVCLFVYLFYQISKRSRWVLCLCLGYWYELRKKHFSVINWKSSLVIHTYDITMKTRPKGHIANKLYKVAETKPTTTTKNSSHKYRAAVLCDNHSEDMTFHVFLTDPYRRLVSLLSPFQSTFIYYNCSINIFGVNF